MLFLNLYLTLIIIGLAPILAGIVYLSGEQIKKIEKKIRAKLADINAIIHETFLNMPVIKVFVNEEKEKKKFIFQNTNYLKRERKFYAIKVANAPLAEFIGFLGILFILGIGGYQILNSGTEYSFNSLMGFLIALMRMSAPIQNLTKVIILIKQTNVSSARVFNLMDEQQEDFYNISKKSLPKIKGKVDFKNVEFSYDNVTKVIKDVSLYAEPGECVALVGQSGSGKTTLVSLITGLFRPTNGKVLIDDIDIWEYDIRTVRKQIAFVTQETFLFHGNILENIVYGCPNATKSQIIEAAKIAHAHDFIGELPLGYYTDIGERGVKLSGGQKQRIALARAIIQKPGILILDEATSALDNESEFLIQEALNEIRGKLTIFIIAHRLSTIVNSDYIYVIEDGKVVEEGKHNKLIEHAGIYKRYYDLQFRI